jgi:hypothetical protein
MARRSSVIVRWLSLIRLTTTTVTRVCRGIYDTSYLSYLRSILSMLPQYGLTAFVGLHQDVWSRYSGGDSAPAWTLEYVGFDLHALEETGAAWLRGVCGGGHSKAEQELWPTGYQKLAAATMAWVLSPHRITRAISDIFSVLQNVLLGWRHVRSEASYTQRYPDSAFLTGRVFRHVGDRRPHRWRP